MPGQPPDNPTPASPDSPGPDRDAASAPEAPEGRGGPAGLDRLAELIERYHDGDTGAEELAELREALMRSAAARELFAQLSLQRQMLVESLSSDYAEMDGAGNDAPDRSASTSPSDSALGLGVVPASDRGFMDLLSELDRGSAQAELVDVGAAIDRWRTEQRRASAADRAELLTLLRPYAVWAGRIAALLAVAVTLIAVLLQLGPSPQAPAPTAAERQADTDRPAPARPTAVATLTQTHDAHWAAFKLSTGDALYAGQRLTLIEGFAQVTTNDGAVALLEAPATFKLLDHNALRLETGKLVGICETASSKGFVVRTEHMDITDLGTRFGVAFDEQRGALTQVFEGRVAVRLGGRGRSDGRPTRLSRGGVVAVDRSGRAAEPDRFASDTFTGLREQIAFSECGWRLSGQIQAAPSQPLSLVVGRSESDEHMLLVPERRSVALPQGLSVFTPRGPLTGEVPGRRIESGTAVDSYTIHLDAAGERDAEDVLFLEGQVRFTRPILGVIYDPIGYLDTSKALGSDAVRYPASTAKLGIEPPEDHIAISDDGRTLTLRLGVSNGVDQIRVLVGADPAEEQEAE